MEKEFELGKIAETMVSWAEKTKTDPAATNFFLRSLKIAVNSPVFHMDISEEEGKINYQKLQVFFSEDLKRIEEFLQTNQDILDEDLREELRKFKDYFVRYIELVNSGVTEKLKKMERKIRIAAGEYTAVIDELRVT